MPLNITEFNVNPSLGDTVHYIEHGLGLNDTPIVQVWQNGYLVHPADVSWVDENALRVVINDQPFTVVILADFDGRKAAKKNG